jgi:hypothetical protein
MIQIEPTRVPEACTLPTADQPVRLAEWDALFAADVTDVRQMSINTIRLALRPHGPVAARAADLAVRETECCAFFEFTVTATGGDLAMQIRTPARQIEVLHALAERARGAAR